jgi:hypothetical protein
VGAPVVASSCKENDVADDGEIEDKFWKALKDSPFLMLGIEGARDGETQPMTAQFEDKD